MFNVNVLIQTLLGSFMTAFKSDFNLVKEDALTFFANKTPRLADIAKTAISEKWGIDQLKDTMSNELTIVESEFAALEVVGKQLIQDSLNAAIQTATDVINQFIPQNIVAAP